MSRFTGTMYYVKNSSQISRVGFMPNEQAMNQGTMRVEFARGGIYDYSPLDRSLYDDFWKSTRKGVFFHSKIKSNLEIEFKKIN
jgi:hypothetical protein